jgi:hypothetical protein
VAVLPLSLQIPCRSVALASEHGRAGVDLGSCHREPDARRGSRQGQDPVQVCASHHSELGASKRRLCKGVSPWRTRASEGWLAIHAPSGSIPCERRGPPGRRARLPRVPRLRGALGLLRCPQSPAAPSGLRASRPQQPAVPQTALHAQFAAPRVLCARLPVSPVEPRRGGGCTLHRFTF